jgi:chromosome segregation ATPase
MLANRKTRKDKLNFMPATIKVSDELLAKLGATAGDFEEKITAHLAKEKTLTEANAELAKAGTEAKEKITALETKLSATPPKAEAFKLSAEDRAAIVSDLKTEAKTAAAQEVSAAIAKAGTGAVGTGKTEDTSGNGDQKPAATDYKGQWDKDENIRAEFIEFGAYEAFKKAESKYRIKIVGR